MKKCEVCRKELKISDMPVVDGAFGSKIVVDWMCKICWNEAQKMCDVMCGGIEDESDEDV